jgi:predicted membrane channel-forming protein YqfA (hemolysin III family)
VKSERESGFFEGSRPVANAKRKNRTGSGIFFLLLGLFSVFSFVSVAGKAGSDPSGALIFFISAPLAVLGGICILVGIVMILLG